jgi:hypothetical protein
VEEWPALQWTEASLAAAAGDCQVTVDWTPNGRGDAHALLLASAGTFN